MGEVRIPRQKVYRSGCRRDNIFCVVAGVATVVQRDAMSVTLLGEEGAVAVVAVAASTAIQ